MSNIGIAAMIYGVTAASQKWGFWEMMKYYGIPWFEVSHWFIMITCKKIFIPIYLYLYLILAISDLHHTDFKLPHYRGKEWTFQRGAAATVDRPFLGWMGRFFLHDVAHYHVIHHFFPKLPWCEYSYPHLNLRLAIY
jgi:fatty acid desaturase